jgi:SNF2 family DNA or RNA helicase
LIPSQTLGIFPDSLFLCDRFPDPIHFLILSCSSVGLNMTGANRVILYDPDW